MTLTEWVKYSNSGKLTLDNLHQILYDWAENVRILNETIKVSSYQQGYNDACSHIISSIEELNQS